MADVSRTGALARALEAMRRGGADKAQVLLTTADKTELTVDAGAISMLRTTSELRLALTAFVEGRKGSAAVNRIDRGAVERAATEAVGAARSSEPDPANDISPAQPARSFGYGAAFPDCDTMHERLASFLAHAGARYPDTRLEQCAADFTRTQTGFANTNGVELQADTGAYDFFAMFTTKKGRRTSSFNYSGATRRSLDEELQHWGSVEELMRQSTEQLDPGSVGEKFVGDLVITPDCLEELVGAIDQVYLADTALITGTSPFKDSLGRTVASPLFTLRSCPVSPEIQNGYSITPDGFPAVDCVLIRAGVLEGFDLSLYGSNKTGKPRSPSAGGCWLIDPGEEPLAEMVSSVKRGLLLCRLSGDNPSDNGDFSGVAKNSYLIEDGSIARPVSETMVAGNLGALLEEISGVSKERIDFGDRIFPWIKAGGVTISGK